MTTALTLRLVLPEWQGFGLHADVHRGALALAADWFAGRSYLTIDAPVQEPLAVMDGVLGLESIAPRFARTLSAIRAAAPDRLEVVGGTCGVELAPVGYLNERYDGELAVLWLDAHADLNTPATSPSSHFHGMVLRALTGEGPAAIVGALGRPLAASQIVLVGTREFDPAEREYVAGHAIPVLGDDVFREPAQAVARLRARGVRRIYIHFDVDVIDPAGFPASLMRSPGGGPSLAEAASLMRVLASSFDVAGLSVLEFCDRGAAWTRAVSAALASVTDAAGA